MENATCVGRTAVHPFTSRACKKAMYAEYKALCTRLGQPNWVAKNYGETKANIVSYETAKALLYKFVAERNYGHWVRKPREEKLFK